jgi:hypothetical protein
LNVGQKGLPEQWKKGRKEGLRKGKTQEYKIIQILKRQMD